MLLQSGPKNDCDVFCTCQNFLFFYLLCRKHGRPRFISFTFADSGEAEYLRKYQSGPSTLSKQVPRTAQKQTKVSGDYLLAVV